MPASAKRRWCTTRAVPAARCASPFTIRLQVGLAARAGGGCTLGALRIRPPPTHLRKAIDDRCSDAFEVHDSGAYLHGTKAALNVGDLLVPGYGSNYEEGRIANHIYFTRTLDAAAWGAELALGDGPGRIYLSSRPDPSRTTRT